MTFYLIYSIDEVENVCKTQTRRAVEQRQRGAAEGPSDRERASGGSAVVSDVRARW